MNLYSRQSNNALYGIHDKALQRNLNDQLLDLTTDYATNLRGSRKHISSRTAKSLNTTLN
jgi:hypothetical protein